MAENAGFVEKLSSCGTGKLVPFLEKTSLIWTAASIFRPTQRVRFLNPPGVGMAGAESVICLAGRVYFPRFPQPQ
jgi:hypothetical protein